MDTTQPGAERRRIGPYVLEERLGTGGMATVYRALDTRLQREVAIKLLREDADPSEKTRARFLREAQAAARLKHPNLVEMFGVEQADGHPFLVMEFVRGTPLQGLSVPRRAAVEILRKVADGIEHAHRHGVVHRDLKPGNIILDEAGEPHVVDFGLAHVEDASTVLTRTGVLMGTPLYMAPEQVAGRPDLIGPHTDVFALGAILYEFLVGQPPHSASSIEEVYAKILGQDPVPPTRLRADVPQDLETIAMKCLEREPARRYSGAAALADDLRRWLDGDPIQARPPSRRYRLKKAISRNRPLLTGLAVGLLVALGAGIWLVGKWKRETDQRREKERQLAAERQKDSIEESARRRAAPFLEAGRRKLESLRIRLRDPEYTREEILRISEAARTEFEKALSECAQLPEAWVGIAQTWALVLRGDLAVPALNRAIEIAPSFAPAYLDRVRLRIGDYENMVHDNSGETLAESTAARELRISIESDLAQVARHSGDNVERLFGEALFAFAKGDYDAAQRLLGDLLRSAGPDAGVHIWRGHSLYHLKRMAEAEEEFTKGLRCDARSAFLLYHRAIARRALRKLDEAKEDFDSAIRIQPADALSRFGRGNLHLDRGEWAEAIADYTRAIEIDSMRPGTFCHRAVALANRGDFRAALSDIDRALAIRPDWVPAFLARAHVRLLEGNFEAMIADCTNVLQRNPNEQEALALRGMGRAATGDGAGALRDLDRALQIRPDDVDSLRNRGGVKMDLGQFAGAVADLDRAVKLRSGSGDLRYMRGSARRRAGDLDGAVEDLEFATRALPRSADAWYELAVARHLRRDFESAIGDYEKALSLAPERWPSRSRLEPALRLARQKLPWKD